MMYPPRAAAALILVSSCLVPAAASDWPEFRGPNRLGVSESSKLPAQWSLDSGAGIAWKTALPGLGHSSPVVSGDRIYLTTAVAKAPPGKLKLGGGIASSDDTGAQTWRVLALDRKTGRILWNTPVRDGTPKIKRHAKASHANPTPATDGKTVVAYFGSEGLYALDAAGKLLWKQDLGVIDVGMVDDPTYQWGAASSPVIHDGRVIVQCDMHKGSFVAAFDLKTGKQLWRSERDEWPSWSTPAIVTHNGRTDIVTISPHFVRGLDPATGKEIWRIADDKQVKTTVPLYANGLLFITGGYPQNGSFFAMKPGATGEASGSMIAWKQDRGSPYTSSPVVYNGRFYSVSDQGILACYEAATGKQLYRERVSTGTTNFSASLVAADGKLYLSSEEGDVYVVKAGPKFELLSTNGMGEPLFATPAISGNLLLVRSQNRLVAIGQP